MRPELDRTGLADTLEHFHRARADGRSNTMPSILDAVNAYATLGKFMGVMRKVFGEYRELVVV